MGEKFLIKQTKNGLFQMPLSKSDDLSVLANSIGVNLGNYDENEIKMGMKEEAEHKDVTGGDSLLTLKIVLAHMKEDPEYYTKLESVMSKGGPGSGRRFEGGPSKEVSATMNDEEKRKYAERLKRLEESPLRTSSIHGYKKDWEREQIKQQKMPWA